MTDPKHGRAGDPASDHDLAASQPPGRFTEPAMTATMNKIAARLSVPATDARLLRLTNNAVYALPAAGMVIRITRSHILHHRVHKVVRLGEWFAKVGAPTIRLADGVEQPIEVDGLLASVWRYLPPDGRAPGLDDLGAVLRQFHRLTPPSAEVPTWDPVADARTRIYDAEALDATDRATLLAWCDDLEQQVQGLVENCVPRLIHGDAHIGNLLRQPDQRVALCDFDATCVGPWQVDLAAVAVGQTRFARHGTHQALATAYGYDVTTDPDWPVLRQARELKMVISAVPLLASAPGIAKEFRARLESIQRHDTRARWTPFADLSDVR